MKAILSALMPSTAVLGAPSTQAEDGIRNIVLVHGAFADASGWDKVAVILTNRGYMSPRSTTR